MRRVDIRSKRPTAWPLVLGALALLGIGWGITVLLRAPPSEPPPTVATAAVDTLPPASIPMAPGQGTGGRGQPLSEIESIGRSDAGAEVRARGVVVATGEPGFWIRSGTRILLVESARQVRTGDTVTVRGTLRPSDPERTEASLRDLLAGDSARAAWTVLRDLALVER